MYGGGVDDSTELVDGVLELVIRGVEVRRHADAGTGAVVDDDLAPQKLCGDALALGHERIGMVLGPEDHVPSRRKMSAFAADAKRAGLTLAPVEHALFSLEGGQAAAARVLRQGVTGLICGSDVLALGAIRAARRAARTPTATASSRSGISSSCNTSR